MRKGYLSRAEDSRREEERVAEEETSPDKEKHLEIHNGCDHHSTLIWAFLDFLKFKKFCI